MFEPAVFKEFEDHHRSPFYCANGLSAVETWGECYERLRHCLAGAVYEAQRFEIAFEVATLTSLHQEIFRSTFPADAGRLRARDSSGSLEHVEYGIEVGTRLTSRVRMLSGAHPDKLLGQLDRAFGEFNIGLASLEAEEPGSVSLGEATLLAATLYAKILRIHPFVDGNLRASYVLLQAALVRMELPQVVWPREEHEAAIATALRRDSRQSYGPLGSLLESAIKSAR